MPKTSEEHLELKLLWSIKLLVMHHQSPGKIGDTVPPYPRPTAL